MKETFLHSFHSPELERFEKDIREHISVTAAGVTESQAVLLACRLAEEGKRVLLVDDVMTTGSTFISCTEALLDAGAARVDCISIATAVFRMAEEDGSSEPE